MNRWASPEGYETAPRRVRYRIREVVSPSTYSALFEGAMKRPLPAYELGAVVERTTFTKQLRGAWHHGLHTADALFFDLITMLIQQACGYFYLPETEYEPLEGVVFDWCSDCKCAIEHHRQNNIDPAAREYWCHGCETACAARLHAVSDDEVRERIHRLDKGENTREAERAGKRAYPISELPWQQQRALIEQVERLEREWAFEILGEDAPAAAEPEPVTQTTADWSYHETPFTDGQPLQQTVEE